MVPEDARGEVLFQMAPIKNEYGFGTLSLHFSIPVCPHKTPVLVTPFVRSISPPGSIKQGTLLISYCELL